MASPAYVPRTLVITLLLVASLSHGSGAAVKAGKQAPPKLMLWSWFAEDDFRPLADPGVGIAYLALSLNFEGQSEVTPSPRKTPVIIPSKTYKMTVIRFDYQQNTARPPSFSQQQRELAAKMVAEIAALARPQAVQIDFDAPQSAWPFYRQLLSDIRRQLGPDIFLSITALVSWCDSRQSWLAGLPVDEIVPMAFHMGRPTPAIVTMLQRGGQFAFPGCRESIGVELPSDRIRRLPGLSSDPTVRPRNGQRAYFFATLQRWSPEVLSDARKAFLQ
jgi:Protein of unknown function (DUF3142)